MKNFFFLLTAVLGLLVFPAFAADVTGKWTADVPGRGGEPAKTTFDFKVSGDTLTGTVTSPRGEVAISDGKVNGDDISFVTTFNEVKIIYKGKVSGDEIKFTREREGGNRPQEFTAKKSS
jgi:hypothetical protein